jgi:hypothetical protein
MREARDDRDYGSRRETQSGTDLLDIVDLLGRRLAGALMVAGALIGVGIYMGSGGDEAPRYQAFSAGGEVFRVNTDSGTVIACNAQRCTRILDRDRDLMENGGNTLFQSPPPTALPAPAGQPAAPAATP